MAWNPSPKVADCREISRKWGHKHQVIILALDRNKGTLQLATYGETKALCADAKRLGELAYQSVFDNYSDAVDCEREHADEVVTELRECLREAIGEAAAYYDDPRCPPRGKEMIARWRKAAGLDTANDKSEALT